MSKKIWQHSCLICFYEDQMQNTPACHQCHQFHVEMIKLSIIMMTSTAQMHRVRELKHFCCLILFAKFTTVLAFWDNETYTERN